MRRFAVAAWVLLLATAGCTDNAPNGPAPTGPANPPPSTAPTTGAPPTSGQAGKQWTMPNLVGRNLQEAQDAMQKLTGDPLFLTTSHDATGRNRQQLLDRDWKVCTQTIAAGSAFTLKAVIDFGAVKQSESCPG
jgi:hypothetical protein